MQKNPIPFRPFQQDTNQVSNSAVVGTTQVLAATANAAATVTCSLVRVRSRSATANAAASVSCTVVRTRARTATANASATVTCGLVRTRVETATANAAATVSCALGRVRARTATANAAAGVSCGLVRVRALVATAHGTATVTAILSAVAPTPTQPTLVGHTVPGYRIERLILEDDEAAVVALALAVRRKRRVLVRR